MTHDSETHGMSGATSGDPSNQTEIVAYPEGYPRLFWFGLVAGWVVVLVGIRGLLLNATAPMPTHPSGWIQVFVGANLGHDFVLVPLVLLIGWLVVRTVPSSVRAPIQAGLIASGIVAFYAYPSVRGFGRRPGNPSILPQNYGRGLLLVLAFIWLIVAGILVWSAQRRTRANPLTHPATNPLPDSPEQTVQ